MTENQQKIIERDYAMNMSKTLIAVRRSFLFYLKRRLGVDEGIEKLPAVQLVVILKIGN